MISLAPVWRVSCATCDGYVEQGRQPIECRDCGGNQIEVEEIEDAKACAWCPRPEGVKHVFLTMADAERFELGARVTHGMCESCEARMLAALES